MNRITKNYLYNLSYQILLIIVPLITAPYLSRVLGPEPLSIYSYVNSISGLFVSFGLFGLNTYGYRQIAYSRDNKNELSHNFKSIILLRCLLVCFISCVYVCVVQFSQHKLYFLLQLALIISEFIDISWLFIGLENLRTVAFRNAAAKIISVICIFLFIKSEQDLWIYFLSFGLSTFVTVVSIIPLTKKYIDFKVKVSWNDLLAHIWPSIKLFIPTVAVSLYLQIDKIMIQNLAGSQSVLAFYEYGEKIISMPLALITALSTAMMPHIANLFKNDRKKEIEEKIIAVIGFSALLGCPMMTGLSAISLKLVPWYLGDNFSCVAYVMLILSPVALFNALTNVSGNQYFSAINDTKILTVSYYSAAIVNITLNFIFIPLWGIYGAAFTTVISTIVVFLLQYIRLSRCINMKSLIIPIVKYIISSVIMGIAVFGIGYYLPAVWTTTIIQILSGVLLYALLLVILKEKNMILLIRKFIHKESI